MNATFLKSEIFTQRLRCQVFDKSAGHGPACLHGHSWLQVGQRAPGSHSPPPSIASPTEVLCELLLLTLFALLVLSVPRNLSNSTDFLFHVSCPAFLGVYAYGPNCSEYLHLWNQMYLISEIRCRWCIFQIKHPMILFSISINISRHKGKMD